MIEAIAYLAFAIAEHGKQIAMTLGGILLLIIMIGSCLS